jgi:MoxR-like ATPase
MVDPTYHDKLPDGMTTEYTGNWEALGSQDPNDAHGWVCHACAQPIKKSGTTYITIQDVNVHYNTVCEYFHPSRDSHDHERDINMATVDITPPTYDGNIHNWGSPSSGFWNCRCGASIKTTLISEVNDHYTTDCALFHGPTASGSTKAAAPRPKTCWDTIEIVLPHAKRTLLYGPPGTGKTHAGVYYGLGDGQDCYSIYITEYTAVSEPRGNIFPVVRDGQRVYEWQDGPATIAYRNGHRLVINEIDKASDDCMTFFLALLDDAAVSRITLPTGEVVPRHPEFSCVATMNARPIALIDPLRDRFPVTINVDIVNPHAVEALPEAMREVASSTANDKTLEDRLGIRAWLEFVHLRQHIDETVAAGILFGKKATQVLTAVRAKEASLAAQDKESAGTKTRAAKAAATVAATA